ncbi:ATP-dependent Clp protease proteolytic subunit [Roseibaca sp. V10]|uniref:ATP-dependent Clp protease proteolytic subunit n=1 Tax=Roseinatronobacter domitianus TaxID=2940293 RepID=A0ABT0M5G2_9RHOB|nr:ATP-dependent Clp protease proteolytic subunit [Roseibaca domitiana]MCL1630102.1 ATP-dependent Clp protease proteolytic subunit [Roseibaca domitiana]
MDNVAKNFFLESLCFALLLVGPALASADEGVSVEEEFLRIDGEITMRTAVEFDRALSSKTDQVWVQLNSPGGSVYSSLLIARRLHEAKLSTRILRDDLCASACALIFAAGNERVATGRLGVHQMSMDQDSNEAIQFAMGDVIEELYAFDVPSKFVTSMLRTPKETMYWFDETEIREMRFYFAANRRELPEPDPHFKEPDLPSGLNYINKGILLIEAYFDQVPERELFSTQATLSAWSEGYSLDLDGQWGPQTENVFREVFDMYTAIGGSSSGWGVNSVADVPRFLNWINDAAYANNNTDRVEFPD